MRKAEFIKKYGEEAWAVELAKRSEYQKRWREEHKEEIRTYQAQYRLDNAERLKENKKKQYLEHREEKCDYQRQYYLENADKVKEYHKQYHIEHPDYNKKQNIKYRQTLLGRANRLKGNYNHQDKLRGFDISDNVDENWIVANVFSGQKCIYCGESDWRKLGVDRIDNSKPHTPDNLICSCGECNVERKDKFTVEEFIKYKKEHPKCQSVEPPLPKSKIKRIKSIFVHLI